MKRILLAITVGMIILSGCQNASNGKLDTSELKKVDQVGLSEENKKNSPISYEAPTLQKGLDALPFEVKLPKNLPFKADPIRMQSIEDFGHEGKKIRVSFITGKKSSEQPILLIITLHNFDVTYSGDGKKVELKDGVEGSLSGNSLIFKKDDIIYNVSYNNQSLSKEEHEKEMVKIANQML